MEKYNMTVENYNSITDEWKLDTTADKTIETDDVSDWAEYTLNNEYKITEIKNGYEILTNNERITLKIDY